MRCLVLSVLVVLLGCSRQVAPVAASHPITPDEARVLASEYRKAALPCDTERLSALIDRDAFRERLTKSDPKHGDTAVALIEGLSGTSMVATKLCAWMAGEKDYKFLRVRQVDGRPRVVMRKSSGITATYHELELTRSPGDSKVRIEDVYSYFLGEWISEEFAGLQRASSNDPTDVAVGLKIQKVTMIEDSQPAEALALLDELPEHLRAVRSIQGWRVKLAQHISVEAYKSALDELSRRFPDDPSVALLQIDGAFLRGDITGALHYCDVVDAAVGPDPFLDGTRAMMLAMRNAAGDLDLAEAKAENAARAEPQLAVGTMAQLSVAVGRHQWTKAVDLLDALEQRFGFRFPDAALRSQPFFKDLVQAPEYEAWRSKHP